MLLLRNEGREENSVEGSPEGRKNMKGRKYKPFTRENLLEQPNLYMFEKTEKCA